MNFRPTSPLPQLTGLGINTRASIPGYPVHAADGHRRWILGHDEDALTIDEDHEHGMFIVHAPDLPGPITIDEADIRRAAAGVANLIDARLWEARRRVAARAELAIFDEDLDAKLAGMIFAGMALRGASDAA